MSKEPTYFIRFFKQPLKVLTGDKLSLYVNDRKTGESMLVHSQKITGIDTLTHWACVDLPGIGVAYFVGNEKLVGVLAERFPGAGIPGD